ncbi:MAG: hypothetical protein V1704_01115, partial [Candidatus Vogelbacteria bacterium]
MTDKICLSKFILIVAVILFFPDLVVAQSLSPTLISADPPNNAIDARDLSGRLGWKFVSLSFSAHLGADWNLATNYTISTTNAEPINIANISGSAVQPIAVFSRKIVPGERVTVTHQPTGAKVCL